MSDIVPIQPDPTQPINSPYYPSGVVVGTPAYSPYTPSTNPTVTDIRLASLLNYTTAQVRDTWVNLGQLEVNNLTRVYTRNTVFRNIEATSPLNGCFFFCNEDYTVSASYTWTHMTVADGISGTIVDSTTYIIDPHFTLVMSQAEFLAITLAYNSAWVPFQETNTNSKVLIEDDELNRLLIEIGVPFINTAELEFSKDDICNYMILPALQVFYKWFPIEVVGSYGVPTGNFRIPMPVWATTGLKAVVNPGFPVGQVPSNPLYRYFDEVLMSISPRGAFSTPNINSSRRQGFVDPMSFATYALERAARTGIMNYSSRTRIRIYTNGRMVTGYSTKRGVLEITWGAMSNVWSDIPYQRLDEVRNLAKAYILRAFAALRMQSRSDTPGAVNYEHFFTRADVLEEKVLTFWGESTKSSIVRF